MPSFHTTTLRNKLHNSFNELGYMSFSVGLDISALDSSFKAHSQRGIGRYVRELKRYMDEHRESVGVRVGYFDHAGLQSSGGAILRTASKLTGLIPFGRTTARQQLLYPLQLASLTQYDAVHFPAHMDPPAWGLKNYIVTVLDLIPLVCADLYKANKSGIRFQFARFLELQAIKNASLCLCISENTAKDVHRILGVPWEKLVVTPLGVDPKFFSASCVGEEDQIRTKYGIPRSRPIVLYVGGIDPRKNYVLMLRAIRDVLQAREGPEEEKPVLVMVGGITGDREYPRLCSNIAELNLKDSVVMPGYVEDNDLLKLYAISRVFFFPSLYEGFGLPPLEAMAAGLPVVSSSSSSMPEVLGDTGLSFNPERQEEAVNALLSVLGNSQLAKSLSEAGKKRAVLFTWDKTGEATIQAYEMLGRKS